jgi:hypothetical protein
MKSGINKIRFFFFWIKYIQVLLSRNLKLKKGKTKNKMQILFNSI